MLLEITLCHIMEKLQPKMRNPLGFFSLYYINIISSVVVLDKIFGWNTKSFKIPTKVDNNATDPVIVLGDNDQELGGINKKIYVTDDQELKGISTNANVTDAKNDADLVLNNDSISKINFITGIQDYTSAMTSRTGGTKKTQR